MYTFTSITLKKVKEKTANMELMTTGTLINQFSL